jgi:hypothetical protein
MNPTIYGDAKSAAPVDAPKVLTDEDQELKDHYLFLGWLQANHEDVEAGADVTALCRTAFLNALQYARAHNQAPAKVDVDAVMEVVLKWQADGTFQCDPYEDEKDLRDRLTKLFNPQPL